MPTKTETRRLAPNRQLMELRINQGLSPNDLAYRAGISGKTVRMAEAGFLPSPRVQHAIAQVFDLSPTAIWPLHLQVGR